MLKRVLAVMAFAFISASAFAQYGTWGYNNTTRQWVPPGVATNQSGTYAAGVPSGIPSNAVYIQPGAAVPTGYCSWRGRLVNVAASAFVGGVIGALAGDNSRAAGKGAAAGTFVGVFIPCQSAHQVAPAQQTPGRLEVYAPKGAQGDSGYTCAIEGEPEVFLVKDRSTCSRLAGRIAQAKVGNTPSAQPASNRADPDKPWGHRGAAGICYLTQELKGEKPASCLQVSVVAANDGESMSSWKARLP